ncbi:MAG: phosphatase PAP2 family protein [bacterium]
MRCGRFVTLLAAMVVVGTGMAEGTPQSSQPMECNCRITSFHYWMDSPDEFGNLVSATGRWDRRGWKGAALFLGATYGLYAFDGSIQHWTQDQRNSTTDRIADFARPFGDGRYTLPGMGAFYLYGEFAKDNRARETALRGVESFILTGLFTQAIKLGGHRHRPSEGDGARKWDGPSFGGGHMAFPSGHASSAFAVATAFAMEYRHTQWASPLAYGIASLTAWSRVNDNAHWASDVFFGAALGFLTSKSIIELHRKWRIENALVMPVSGGDAPLSFALSFQF